MYWHKSSFLLPRYVKIRGPNDDFSGVDTEAYVVAGADADGVVEVDHYLFTTRQASYATDSRPQEQDIRDVNDEVRFLIGRRTENRLAMPDREAKLIPVIRQGKARCT